MLYQVADRAQDEEGWLRARRNLITASESCHLVGTAHRRWRKSPDELHDSKMFSNVEVTAKMRAGQFWENSILEWFSELTGIAATGASALLANTQFPGLGATPDGTLNFIQDPKAIQRAMKAPTISLLRVVGAEMVFEGPDALAYLVQVLDNEGFGGTPLEVKNQESKNRYKWNREDSSKVVHYVTQVNHQTLVMEQKLGLLAARVDANELYIHCVPADKEHQQEIIDETRRYHDRFSR